MKNENSILKDNSFVTIEAAVLLNKNLTNTEKILYGYIVAFSQAYGYCNMKNSTMCEIMNLKIRQLKYCLAKLKKYNYITTVIKNNVRYITPTINRFIETREKTNKLINWVEYNWLEEE